MRPASEVEAEAWLTRESRARLPFAHQILLYLHPFAFFKDASKGPKQQQERALSYNRAMRWMLIPYMRRWVSMAIASFLTIAPAEALAAQASFFIFPAAAFAVGTCVAVVVSACTVVAYVLLGTSRA
jgi:hypothetical protein